VTVRALPETQYEYAKLSSFVSVVPEVASIPCVDATEETNPSPPD